MPQFLSGMCRTACGLAALAGAVLMAPATSAGQVSLEATDGSFLLTGQILGLEDDHYVVQTPLGEIRVGAARVRCAGEGCPTGDLAAADVRIAGPAAVSAALMPPLLEGYAAQLGARTINVGAPAEGDFVSNIVGPNGAIGRIAMLPRSGEAAVAALLEGTAEIGLAAGRIRPPEAGARAALEAGDSDVPRQEHVLATESLVVVAHPGNPVSEISLRQLADVFAGRITNWSELGGADLPIRLAGLPEVPGPATESRDATIDLAGPTTVAMTVAAGGAVPQGVADDPAAIAVVPRALRQADKALVLVDACGTVLSPDAFSVKSGAYPLQRPIYLYSRGDATNVHMSGLIDYALSPDAEAAITAAGLVDLGVERRPLPAGTGASPLAELAGHDQLSSTFRFGTGSSRLTDRGAADLTRLVDYLKAQPEGTMVRFVGFSDDIGSPARNRALSERRASEVAGAVRQAGGDALDALDIAIIGLGEKAPSACNASEEGRAINRRVEVWIERGADG